MTWLEPYDPKFGRGLALLFFVFFGGLTLDLLDYSGLHLGVHALSLQGSSSRSQFCFGDCCCDHLIGLGIAVHFVRDTAIGKAEWH